MVRRERGDGPCGPLPAVAGGALRTGFTRRRGPSRTLDPMRLGKRLYSLLVFLGVAVLGGLLTAGFVVPAVSMVASTGRDAALSLDALPTELDTPAQSERSRVEMANGELLTYFYNQNRVYKSLSQISPIMAAAQVAIEDHRFYEHGAIDLQGTLRALVSTSQGVTQGGSSITQQYVRLVLIDTAEANNDQVARAAATENTMARKIRELRFAIALEKKFSKDEILERYLNISYYGDGAYGVEAAARHYFGIPAKDLNLAQSAMLAGLVRNPVTTNPVKYPQVALERRNNVIDRMVELGAVTKAEGVAAKAEPFDKDKVVENKLDCGNARYPFICDYAKRVILTQASSLGSTQEEREYRLYRGGLNIRLTVDPKIQKQSEKTIANYVDPRDPVVSVITMVEPATGSIVSMAQSRPKMGDNKENGKDKWRGESYYNYAVSHGMGGADGFQGGSTFKAFVAAAALEAGMGAYGKYNAKRVMEFEGPYKSCDGEFMLDKPWKVTNASPSGVMDMFAGVRGSVNTYFAQLIQAVGVCAAVEMADKLGLEVGKPSTDHPDVLSYNSIPSFTLGTIETPPLSLVEAFATFANRGVHCEPVIVASIKTREGVALDVPSADCKRVISKDVADAINKIFQGPMNGGTARLAKISGVQMAGKTGTVPDNRAVWTVGYTPNLVAAAVMSYDNDPRFAKFWKARNGRYLNGAYLKYSEHYVYGRSGSEAGGKLLKPAMSYALENLKGYETKRFNEPPASVLRGEWVSVPSCNDMGVGTCKSRLRKAGFTYFTDEVASDAAKGTIVGTSPSGKAPKMSAIAIEISKGPKKGSQAWCALEGNAGRAECVKYLPPPVCGEGEVLVPDPPPGYCMPVPPDPGPGDGGGEGGPRRPR